jgi:Zn-dependent membrane protease YugP
MVLGVLLNLVTLPVEWDASFGKALPLLENGEYLSEKDMASARQILTAAALTYVAASLTSLLNLGVLARVLRR